MQMTINYQQQLDKTLAALEKKAEAPTLLLHSCCAPCSSYVLEYLSDFFQITVFYYNPNIYPREEYDRRRQEQERFLTQAKPGKYPVKFIVGEYEDVRFYEAVRGLEQEMEGGERCFCCYALRLREAAVLAKEHGFDYFTTTLSISPYKNAQKLNEIGRSLEEELGVSYLYSDFKKKNGYKRSLELSKEYGLYRQEYCGCIFSQRK